MQARWLSQDWFITNTGLPVIVLGKSSYWLLSRKGKQQKGPQSAVHIWRKNTVDHLVLAPSANKIIPSENTGGARNRSPHLPPSCLTRTAGAVALVGSHLWPLQPHCDFSGTQSPKRAHALQGPNSAAALHRAAQIRNIPCAQHPFVLHKGSTVYHVRSRN